MPHRKLRDDYLLKSVTELCVILSVEDFDHVSFIKHQRLVVKLYFRNCKSLRVRNRSRKKGVMCPNKSLDLVCENKENQEKETKDPQQTAERNKALKNSDQVPFLDFFFQFATPDSSMINCVKSRNLKDLAVINNDQNF